MDTQGAIGLCDIETEDVKEGRHNKENDKFIECEEEKLMIYGINETPPIHVTIVCALQQALLALSGSLIVSLLVADAVCASKNEVFKARLLSSTLFMNGVTTIAMNLLGIRLPLFQGASSEYIVPLLLMATQGSSFCTNAGTASDNAAKEQSLNRTALNNTFPVNGTETPLEEQDMETILYNVQALQGSLMLAGLVHALVGFTGLIGVLLRYIGPLTIVTTLVLIFIFISKAIMKYVEVNWGITLSTIAVCLILSLYLSKYKMPILVWTPSGGFRIIRYPLHQVFAILISIITNWVLCGILTYFDVLPNDPTDIGYNARTDSRLQVISQNPWVNIPYPGQYGRISFSSFALLSFMIATLISILDSIADYFACARLCRIPAPPTHAVNRGILVEGLCSFLSGAVGCGHATSSNSGCLGAIGVTRVASRQVFVFTGILYILFAIFGKFCALFVTIPYPVLGGAVVVLFGIFFGVIISNLEVTKMSSPRNIAILGLSTFIGLIIPSWAQKVGNPVNTGNTSFDNIAAMILGNPNLIGTVLACFLDNTVPGTREERGIEAWQVGDNDDNSTLDWSKFDEGYEVYEPLFPKSWLRWKLIKYVPFLPFRGNEESDEI